MGIVNTLIAPNHHFRIGRWFEGDNLEKTSY